MDSRTLTDKMQKRGCCFLLLDPRCVDSARSLSRSLRVWSTFTPRSAGPHGTRFWLGELPWGGFFKVKLMPPCSKAHPRQNGIFSTCHADIHRVPKRPGRIPEGIFSRQRRGSWMDNISNSFLSPFFTCFLPEDISIEGGQEVVPEVCMVTVIQQLWNREKVAFIHVAEWNSDSRMFTLCLVHNLIRSEEPDPGHCPSWFEAREHFGGISAADHNSCVADSATNLDKRLTIHRQMGLLVLLKSRISVTML